MGERGPRTGAARAGAWLAVVAGVVLVQIGAVALTVRGVEADLARTVGTPPLWQPAALAVGLALLGAGCVALVRRR